MFGIGLQIQTRIGVIGNFLAAKVFLGRHD